MEKEKFYFGVFQDGYEIKIASLVERNNELFLDRLYKRRLPEVSEESNEFDSFDGGVLDDIEDEENSPSFENGEFDMEDKSPDAEFETVGGETDTKSKNITSVLRDVAEEMGFERGKIALNLEVSNIKYRKMDIPPKLSQKKIINKLNKEFYEGPAPLASYSFFRLDQFEDEEEEEETEEKNNIIAIGHEGKMELLENLLTVSSFLTKKRFSFNLIQPNEITLVNAVRMNYELHPDEVSAILYIGVDHSRITLMKGNQFWKELPIINEGYESEDITKTVFSRFMLERSHLDVGEVNNIFLCGEDIGNETIEFLKERESEANVELLLPKNIFDDITTLEDYDNSDLTEYIIPIMLAASLKYQKDPRLINVNFIPKQLKEQQNIFSINIPGFISLGLILFSVLFGLHLYFNKKQEISQVKSKNQQLKNQMEIKQTVIDTITAMETKIQKLETSIERANTLIGSKNQNHYIVEKISDGFRKNPLTWATSITSNENSVVINAITTRRRNVVELSKLFPEGKIDAVTETSVQGFTAWEFRIDFMLPDPLETKRQDFKREGLVYKKNEKTKVENNKVKESNSESDTNVSSDRSRNVDYNEIDMGKPKLYVAALNLYRKGNFQSAKNKFLEYRKNNNDIWALHSLYFIAECNYGLEQYSLARNQFEEILSKKKIKLSDTKIMLGNVYEKLGDLNQARKYWKRVVDEHPNSKYYEIAQKKLKETSG